MRLSLSIKIYREQVYLRLLQIPVVVLLFSDFSDFLYVLRIYGIRYFIYC